MIRETGTQLGAAYVRGDGTGFAVGTGVVERRWRFTPHGAATMRLARRGGRRWVRAGGFDCDWSLPGLTGDGEPAELIALDAEARRGVDYTADHVALEAVFRCSSAGFDVRYSVWAYPDAPGVRTQVALRPRRAFAPGELPTFLGGARSERLPLAARAARLFAAGYYNDTQHRNYDHTPILRTQAWPSGRKGTTPIDWANLIALERGGEGVALVKESHKCVNQEGVDTGAFVVGEGRVEVTGLGLTPNHYAGGLCADRCDRWHECWATWVVLYSEEDADDIETARELAIKRMDRCRFPFRPERDRWIMANTWGSGGAGEGSRSAAAQANVLRELASAADLGIEIVQIDDGWQAEPDEEQPTEAAKDWRPGRTRWPDGWTTLRAAADRLGVALGLWFPWYVETEAIAWNVEHGGFRRLKLDFMHLRGRGDIERLTAKVRELVDRFGPGLGINWDATEVSPRMGYYFGRDHGNVYLANRPAPPAGQVRLGHVTYAPRLTLREAWHLAHYMNLNQVQITLQNVDRVNPAFSNAVRHGHDYCFAITMMGLPIFFQETHYYGEEARRQLRPIIALYKRHRDAILGGYVFAIGDEPCDRAWCGFQSHRFGDGAGHLTVFRELHNADEEAPLRLRFAGGRQVALTDLLSGESFTREADEAGAIVLRLPAAPSFGFYEYRLRRPRR